MDNGPSLPREAVELGGSWKSPALALPRPAPGARPGPGKTVHREEGSCRGRGGTTHKDTSGTAECVSAGEQTATADDDDDGAPFLGRGVEQGRCDPGWVPRTRCSVSEPGTQTAARPTHRGTTGTAGWRLPGRVRRAEECRRALGSPGQ